MDFIERNPILSVFLGFIALLVLGFGGWGLSVALAPVFGAGNAYKTTESGDYRIANYEHFKDSCNGIVATDGKIVVARKVLDTDTRAGVDSFTLLRDRENVQALINTRLEQITAYNSDASKEKTKAKWLSVGLPTHIPVNAKIGSVTCS